MELRGPHEHQAERAGSGSGTCVLVLDGGMYNFICAVLISKSIIYPLTPAFNNHIIIHFTTCSMILLAFTLNRLIFF